MSEERVPVSDGPGGSRSSSEERSDETKRVSVLDAPNPTPQGRPLRRGLPRVPGGEPWPPVGTAPDEVVAAGSAGLGAGIAATAPTPSPRSQGFADAPTPVPVFAAAAPAAEADVPSLSAPSTTADARPLRRGLPRVAGGEPWPPPGLFVADSPVEASAPAAAAPEVRTSVQEAQLQLRAEAEAAPTPPARTADYSSPLPFTPTVWAGAAARTRPEPKPEPQRIGPFTRLQWAGAVIVGGGALLYAGLLAVLAVRFLLSTPWGMDFLAAYPGEYHLPEGAPVGFPAWLGWQHFFNVFLMVLIIRTGLQVRTEKRPSVFWSPRTNGKRKISLNLWFHQSLDILWLVNGVIFVVLLFLTGQWMRIVPTSWEVFPNAFSATLQYVSLDWPTENGWVNYNSLQQLAYFATVFIAAPLAAITGVRMSGIWPKDAKTLNRIYPVEWARAVHFPVMLYFVLFIFVHVVLVFATGALRNLNHMYAAQGSVDPDAYAMNWTGFWIFAVSMLVIVAAWVAARPLVLAPIARLFGKVSGR
nr:cytochrome b/b6 domain-containing protein [Microbacterium sp. MF43]